MAGILLFSYGTLQDPAVQIAYFGRTLVGKVDWLDRFVRFRLTAGLEGWVYVRPE